MRIEASLAGYKGSLPLGGLVECFNGNKMNVSIRYARSLRSIPVFRVAYEVVTRLEKFLGKCKKTPLGFRRLISWLQSVEIVLGKYHVSGMASRFYFMSTQIVSDYGCAVLRRILRLDFGL